jgi:hypothetical protein
MTITVEEKYAWNGLRHVVTFLIGELDVLVFSALGEEPNSREVSDAFHKARMSWEDAGLAATDDSLRTVSEHLRVTAEMAGPSLIALYADTVRGLIESMLVIGGEG